MSRSATDDLKMMHMRSISISNTYTPLSYLKGVSKSLTKKNGDIGCLMREEMKPSSDDMIMQCAPQRMELAKKLAIQRKKSY